MNTDKLKDIIVSDGRKGFSPLDISDGRGKSWRFYYARCTEIYFSLGINGKIGGLEDLRKFEGLWDGIWNG